MIPLNTSRWKLHLTHTYKKNIAQLFRKLSDFVKNKERERKNILIAFKEIKFCLSTLSTQAIERACDKVTVFNHKRSDVRRT